MQFERPLPHENAARFEGLIGFTAGKEGFRPDLVSACVIHDYNQYCLRTTELGGILCEKRRRLL